MRDALPLLLLAASTAFGAGNKLGSPREDDAPAAAKAGAAAEEPALLRGLLWAFEPAPSEIRVLAVEDLGLLGDPRALNPLAQLIGDSNPMVQAAAIRAIGAMRHPRAEEILANVVRHPSLPEKLKVQSIDTLLLQNTRSSLLFLHLVARSPLFSFNLQNAARRVLQNTTPEATGRTGT